MLRQSHALRLALASVVGCGSSPAGPGNNTGTADLTFTVDGTAYTGGLHTAVFDGTTFVVTSANNVPQTILLSWIDAGTGNYSAGSAFEVRAFYTQGLNSWIANNNKGTGAITVTSRTSSRIKDTFAFVLDPDTGTGTKTIASGTFDLPY